MSIIESLWLFFLPPFSDKHVLVGHAEPWTLLLAVLAAFVLVSLSFWHRLLDETKTSMWRFSPLPINAMTLTVALILVPLVDLIAISTFREQGFRLALLFIPSLLTFVMCYVSLRLISFAVNSGVKIMLAALLTELAIIFQGVLSLSGVNGVAIAHFNIGLFLLGAGLSSLCLSAAFWFRFSPEKHGRWDRNLSSALFGGGLVTLAVLIMSVITRDAIGLSAQSLRIGTSEFNGREIALILIFGTVFVLIFSQMANALYRLKEKINHLANKSAEIEAVMQTVCDAVIAIDKKGVVTFFNQSAEHILGWDASEIIGKNVNILVTDEHQHRHDSYIEHFFQRQESSVLGTVREVIAKRKDGTILPIRLAIGHRSEKYASNHEFVAVLSDISEQRHIARALKESAKQYRSLIANLPCMAFREMTGSVWHIVYISDVAKSITGYSASALTGENGVSHLVDRIHQSDVANYRKVRESASLRNGKYDCEYRFLTRNNEEKWFWEIGHSYRAEDGNTWIDGVILDITDRHEANQEIADRKRLVENASQSKATFLANMSYEFRSPMNSILSLTSILLNNEKNPINRQHLEVIKDSGENLMTLITDILDTSKLESETLPLDISSFSLAQLCRQIEFIGSESVRNKGGRVTLFYSEKLAEHYVGDAGRIKQLLQNMLRCALTKTAEGNIGLHVIAFNDMVRFVVGSYSTTINMEKGDTTKNNGHTLAATLIAQLVDLMRGHLWFDGESIHNSLVYADLPIIASPHAGQSNHDNIQHYALPAIEVLVIDDVQRNQQELRDMSLRQGVKVLTCSDVGAAEDIIKTQQIDVVLLDAYIQNDPELTLATLRQWAQQAHKSLLRVIALKLFEDETPESEWKRQGFDGVINKPFESEAVFGVLRRSLGLVDVSNKITLLNPLKSESEASVFDEIYATQRWPTPEILLSVVRKFIFEYSNLPSEIYKMLDEKSPALSTQLLKAKEAAHYLGFQKVELELHKMLLFIEEDNIELLTLRIDVLSDTLAQSFEKAMAILGIRADDLNDDGDISNMTPELFSRRTEQFISKLAEGQFDESLYNILIPDIVTYLDPPLLAQFIEAIENFELDEAYQLFLTALDKFPTTQDATIKDHGM